MKAYNAPNLSLVDLSVNERVAISVCEIDGIIWIIKDDGTRVAIRFENQTDDGHYWPLAGCAIAVYPDKLYS